MKKLFLGKLILGGVLIMSSNSYAAGKITGIDFSGPDDPNHPNIVQIQIEGGYNTGSCNNRFAAIRDTADRKNMVAFALKAYLSKEPVNILLNKEDKYFSNRCTISRISSIY